MRQNKHWTKLEASLEETISEWFLEGEAWEKLPESETPYIGENTSTLMAQAAIAVLMALKDSQDHLEREGLLVEED